jgi:hypothetical protein
LYINGALEHSNGADAIVATGAWTIGKQNCSPCRLNGFAGSLDELAEYDYALSDARIEAHYRVGRE